MASLGEEVSNSEIYFALGLNKLSKETSATPRVLSLLSLFLERTIRKNEKQLESRKQKNVATIFDGVRAPTLSIQQYIDRLFRYLSCSPSCFLVAQVYIDRFLQRANVYLTSLNVHRLLITSLMVASKFLDEVFLNNAYYAKVGGLSTAEMNRLEINFLFSLDFKLHISVETFDRYCLQLTKEGNEGTQSTRSIQINDERKTKR